MNIFKSGKFNYYISSRFLPKGTRDDVFKLYSFVQTVNKFVDQVPSDIKSFERIESRWKTVKKDLARGSVPAPLDDSVSERAIANIGYVMYRYGCDYSWVDAYLKSMRWDAQKHVHRSLKDTLEYMYGSSEVVGLILARILNLPEESLEYARLQARAISYINFLRNIANDNADGRCYFPVSDIKVYGLKNLSEKEARSKPKMFTDFVHAQLLHYAQWQTEANKGFMYIPKRLRVPLQTFVDVNNLTAQKLKNNPLLVFEKKLKPKRRHIVSRVVKRGIQK